MGMLELLGSQYNTRIIFPERGEVSRKYDSVIISAESDAYYRFGPWKIWDAPHTIPTELFPSWVKTPLLIIVNRDEVLRSKEILSIGKRLDNVYKTQGEILPCGNPISVRKTHLDPLRIYRNRLKEALRECPGYTIKRKSPFSVNFPSAT